MSEFGPMIYQGGRKGFFRSILESADPGLAARPDTGKPPTIVFSDNLLDDPGILSLSGGVCAMPSIKLVESFD